MVNLSSKCYFFSCDASHLRKIWLHFNGSFAANGSRETFPASCARARFAGCTLMRRIVFALNTVHLGTFKHVEKRVLS